MAKKKAETKIQIPARQGDVLIIATEAHEPIGDEVTDPRGVVLADGESSGHFHAVVGDGAKLFRFRSAARDRLLVVGDGGAEVRVVGGGTGGGASAPLDRHAVVSLAPGKYTIRTQREWSIADERALHSPD